MEEDDDPVPEDIDEFRSELARRIRTFVGIWRDCNLPLCKRARACRATTSCAAQRNEPPATRQEMERAKAKVWFLLQRRIEDIDRESAAEAAAADAASVRAARAGAGPVTRSRKSVRGRR